MKAAYGVFAVGMLVVALGACGGKSAEEKAQTTVCDARDDIGEQVADLKGLTPATVTIDAVTKNLDAIRNDLQDISDALPDLTSDRRSEFEAANKEFTSSVKDIVSEFGTLTVGLGRQGRDRHGVAAAGGVLPEGVRAAELRLERTI